MKPKVSIIIPCYGVENYLDRCMKTIVNQTLKDIEIIMVDDGSPDRVPEMCDEWAKKDSRIKVIHKQNAGLGYARNSGLEIATGEYVAFVDSDDYIDMNMYEKLVFESESGVYDVVYCGIRHELSEDNHTNLCDFNKITTFTESDIENVVKGLYRSDIFTKKLFISVWHSIYKLDVIKKNNISFYSEREILSEDLPFQTQFLLNSKFVKFIPNALYTYCVNVGSLTNGFKISQLGAAKRLQHLLEKILPLEFVLTKTVDIEYFLRVGWLIRKLLKYGDMNFSSKYSHIRQLCNDETWSRLVLSDISKNSSKILIFRFFFLKYKFPLLVILHNYFSEFCNKRFLFKILRK